MTEKTIVPNNNPDLCMVTSPNFLDDDTPHVVELCPIVAWVIEDDYADGPWSRPVLANTYTDGFIENVIVDRSTWAWCASGEGFGGDKDSLVEYLLDIYQVRERREMRKLGLAMG